MMMVLLIQSLSCFIFFGSGDQSEHSNPWKEKMEEFAGMTTLHGAPKIILAPTPATRTGWLVVVLCSWSIFLYQVVLVCDNYFRFPKKTNIEVVYDRIAFPGVTFCSHRGVSFYDAEEWSRERIMAAPPPRNPSKDDVDYYEYDDSSDRRPQFQLVYHDVVRDLKFIDPVFRSRTFQSRVKKSAITREELFLKLHALIGSNELKLHRFSDFDIKQIDGGEFLSCYTVEIPKAFLFQIRSLRGNLMTGKGLTSKASNDKMYIWNSMPTRGEVRVYIHPPGMNMNPRFEKKYFDVQPDQLTVFSVAARNSSGSVYRTGTVPNEIRSRVERDQVPKFLTVKTNAKGCVATPSWGNVTTGFRWSAHLWTTWVVGWTRTTSRSQTTPRTRRRGLMWKDIATTPRQMKAESGSFKLSGRCPRGWWISSDRKKTALATHRVQRWNTRFLPTPRWVLSRARRPSSSTRCSSWRKRWVEGRRNAPVVIKNLQ